MSVFVALLSVRMGHCKLVLLGKFCVFSNVEAYVQ